MGKDAHNEPNLFYQKTRNEEGCSLNEIVTETGYDWRTVRKYADHDVHLKKKKKDAMFR